MKPRLPMAPEMVLDEGGRGGEKSKVKIRLPPSSELGAARQVLRTAYTPLRYLRAKDREQAIASNHRNQFSARKSRGSRSHAIATKGIETPCPPKYKLTLNNPLDHGLLPNTGARSMVQTAAERSVASRGPVDTVRGTHNHGKDLFPRTPLLRTYGTQSRTMLESQTINDTTEDASETVLSSEDTGQNGICSPHRSKDAASPPLFMSQESKSLEEAIREGRRGMQVPNLGRSGESRNSAQRNYEDDTQGVGTDGHAYDEQGDLNGVSSEQDALLDPLDIEILNLGSSEVTASGTQAAPRPRRSREQVNNISRRDSRSRTEHVNEDSEHDLEQQQTPTKKRRTKRRIPSVESSKANFRDLRARREAKASKKNKSGYQSQRSKKSNRPGKHASAKAKQPRRIPDHSLVTVEERPYDSDLRIPSSLPLELSQDPISRIQSDEEQEGRGPEDRSMPLQNKPISRKGNGKIDISQFRIPERRPEEQHNRRQKSPSYSDGFEGKEGLPIGRVMPIKQISRGKQCHVKVSFKLGTLTLVDTKPYEIERPHRRGKKRKRAHAHQSQAQEDPTNIEDDDGMLLDAQEEQLFQDDEDRLFKMPGNVPSGIVSREPHTPAGSSGPNRTSSTPVSSTSPLKRKSQGNRLPSSMSIESLQARPNFIKHLQETVRPVSTKQTTTQESSQQQSRRDAIAEHEISQVSLVRPYHYSEEDDQEDYEDDAEHRGKLIEEENSEDSDGAPDDPCSDDDLDETEIELGKSSSPYPTPNILSPNVSLIGGDEDDTENCTVAAERRANSEVIDSNTGSLPAAEELSRYAANLFSEIDQRTEEAKGFQKKRRIEKHSSNFGSLKTLRASSKKTRRPPEDKLAFETPVDRFKISDSGDQQPGLTARQAKLQVPDDPDSSYRPRIPDTSGAHMETREEIEDILTPPERRRHVVFNRRRSLRQRSIVRGQPLRTATECPESQGYMQQIIPALTHDSQGGSIELGSTQNFAQHSFPSTIPETQVQDVSELQESQITVIPENTYFSQASQHLSASALRSRAIRMHSMPAKVHFARQRELEQDSGDVMAGGISMSAAFQHTISSPVKTPGSQRRSLMYQSSSQLSLKELTRQASLGMGTVQSSARKRTVSISLLSQFNK